jgi:hypothetical protein
MSMPAAVTRLAHHAASHAQPFALLLLAILGAVASVNSPVQHALLVTALSWLLVWLVAVARVGLYSNTGPRGHAPSALAGALLALAHICDRAACDKDGIRATKWLLPLCAVAASHSALLSRHLVLPSHTAPDDAQGPRSLRMLLALTAAAAAALAIYVTSTTAALGTSSAIFAASGLVAFEAVVRGAKDDNTGGARGLMSADGSVTRRSSISGTHTAQQLAALRDVAAALALVCGVATCLIEPSIPPGAITWEPLYREFDRDWKTVHDYRTMRQVAFMVLVNVVLNGLVFLVVG